MPTKFPLNFLRVLFLNPPSQEYEIDTLNALYGEFQKCILKKK